MIARAKYSSSCSLADSESLLGSLLLGQSHLFVLSCSLNVLGLFGGDEFDMAIRREIGSNSTVGSVCSSSSLYGSLDDEVTNIALINVQALSLSISLKVFEELNHVFD